MLSCKETCYVIRTSCDDSEHRPLIGQEGKKFPHLSGRSAARGGAWAEGAERRRGRRSWPSGGVRRPLSGVVEAAPTRSRRSHGFARALRHSLAGSPLDTDWRRRWGLGKRSFSIVEYKSFIQCGKVLCSLHFHSCGTFTCKYRCATQQGSLRCRVILLWLWLCCDARLCSVV